MLDAFFSALSDLVFYHLGRWALLVLTAGRYDATERNANEGLVSLFGFLVFVILVFAAVLFFADWA
jgi:hypothetical protein